MAFDAEHATLTARLQQLQALHRTARERVRKAAAEKVQAVYEHMLTAAHEAEVAAWMEFKNVLAGPMTALVKAVLHQWILVRYPAVADFFRRGLQQEFDAKHLGPAEPGASPKPTLYRPEGAPAA